MPWLEKGDGDAGEADALFLLQGAEAFARSGRTLGLPPKRPRLDTSGEPCDRASKLLSGNVECCSSAAKVPRRKVSFSSHLGSYPVQRVRAARANDRRTLSDDEGPSGGGRVALPLCADTGTALSLRWQRAATQCLRVKLPGSDHSGCFVTLRIFDWALPSPQVRLPSPGTLPVADTFLPI